MAAKHIAVIGAGYWGKNLVRNFYQLGVLKTICDSAQSIREEMAKTYPSYSLPGGDNLNSLPLDGGGQGGGE